MKDLLVEFDGVSRGGGREKLAGILDPYRVSLTSPRSGPNGGVRRYDEEGYLWGHVLSTSPSARHRKRSSEILGRRGLGIDPPVYPPLTVDEIVRRNARWSRGCTFDRGMGAGYTCGLWQAFHILTVGAGREENQLYGLRRGYDVSPRRVGVTVKNFVEAFFGCEVCCGHFLDMYDGCGFDHCTRLSRDGVVMEGDADKEVALWMFEVHNAGTYLNGHDLQQEISGSFDSLHHTCTILAL